MVLVGNFSGEPARTTPETAGTSLPSAGDQLIGYAVVGFSTSKVGRDQPVAGNLAFAYRTMNVVDCSFLEMKVPRTGSAARRTLLTAIGGLCETRYGQEHCQCKKK